jgi:hypothetical protein
VWMILEAKGLASSQDIGNAWTKICSIESKAKPGKPDDEEKFNDIRNLLMRYGGFSPPPTPKADAKNGPQWTADGSNSNVKEQLNQATAPSASEQGQSQQPKSKQKQKQKQRPRQNVDQPRPPFGQLSSQSQAPIRVPEQQKISGSGRRNRGRGKATM